MGLRASVKGACVRSRMFHLACLNLVMRTVDAYRSSVGLFSGEEQMHRMKCDDGVHSVNSEWS